MANICSYSLKVLGNHQDVCNFYNCLLGDEEYEKDQMATRIYDAECYKTENTSSGTAFYITGSCAWSVLSSFIDYSEPDGISILPFSKEHKLTLEFFSDECGMEFAEHYIIKAGTVTTSEVVKYKEFYIEDVEEDLKSFLEDDFVKEKGITKENYLEKFGDDDWLYLGGFVDADFTI